ncbi:MAG: hypothetical protein JJU31_02130 [Wenzhouxiangella sp.]|nr:hypothetical protein [Wenzhouxiangella sp.]MCH8476656.1 hypothetical protein [Wenzhouxiangella sp.]TVR96861.1 MAG: hypothetical protein EA418_04545 [Wenzhouxiangellaceae bacterium]
MSISDRDWRLFLGLRDAARQRFAEDTLSQALAICLDERRTTVEREQALADLTRQREHEQAALFDDHRRRTATLCLHFMRHRGLVRDEELKGFSLAVRRTISADT